MGETKQCGELTMEWKSINNKGALEVLLRVGIVDPQSKLMI